MKDTDLPPLPAVGATGYNVCETIRLYLAVWNDVPAEQRRVALAHVQSCADCQQEYQQLNQATNLLHNLPASSPSPGVDRAVMAAINAAASKRLASTPYTSPVLRVGPPIKKRRRTPVPLGGLVAAAAVVFIAILTGAYFLILPSMQAQAFALPANLTWNTDVLYHTQTMKSGSGKVYKVTSYHDLATGRMNVETTMDGELDVVLVSDAHDTLGMDMMHHVAQWGATQWSVDESMFNLKQLRSDLQTKHAVYDGKAVFHGQNVYRIRYADGEVLLLDMDYMPVNVLQTVNGSNTSTQVYDTLQWLPHSKVPTDMWGMNVPTGFKMGTLPAKPS